MITAILLRDFAASQEKRLSPALADKVLVLIQAGRMRPKVIAPDATARQMGVKAGMALREAQSLCPEGLFLPVEESRYRRLFADLTLSLLEFTPRLEMEYQATSAVWYTDDTNMLPLLLQAIETKTGIAAQVGIAKVKFVARVAAAVAQAHETCIVAETQAANFLASFPVSLLPLDKTMKRRLPLLGIETLGQYAHLPRIAAWEQFGKHGRWLHDLAGGIDPRPLSPYKAALRYCAAQSFEDGISDRFALYQSLECLSLKLMEAMGEAEAKTIQLILHLEDKTVLESERLLPEAVRDALTLLRLLRQMLDSLPLAAAVTQIEVRLSEISQRKPVQLSLFGEKKPVRHLQDYLPEWASRHRAAQFYRLNLHEAAVLEERLEKLKVEGA